MSDVIILSIGMADKDTKTQKLSDAEFIDIIYKYLDCTITHTTGIYTHDDGTRVVEPSLKVEVYNRSYDDCIEVAKKLLVELNQECIVISKNTYDVVNFINQ